MAAELPPNKVERIKQYLKCDFTREEVEKFSSELAEKLEELDRAELRKKDVVATIKSEIARLDMEIKKLRSNVKDRYEHRNVDCERTTDWKQGRLKVVRLDTNETVADRPLTPAERQIELGL
jgi:peptidoglycan hydrolase CwlO-like protein